jgi:hypothetical protein
MSVTTMYRLPTAEDLAWIEDLVGSVESRLGDVHSSLKAPFDGNPETEAEPATLDYVGRVFLFTRFLRSYAEGFIERADRLESAVVELRDIQEEADDLLPDKEPYSAYVTRHARQWAEAAAGADETLEYAKAQGRVDGS